jgi:hypothetical protein
MGQLGPASFGCPGPLEANVPLHLERPGWWLHPSASLCSDLMGWGRRANSRELGLGLRGWENDLPGLQSQNCCGLDSDFGVTSPLWDSCPFPYSVLIARGYDFVGKVCQHWVCTGWSVHGLCG